ncbi:sensor histidine kinase [Hymenobacter wooponensis]|uniref:Histidine kinase n=1 Tax=Hymenobacter wooponensis TaxID=1525360 RepID=A0A4Z0MMA6_9BACT|nr:sensor histidine kinase [Hymenobacter wooponensis]TGD80520.1 histidine kinase [Hymenobacter wooponensis]
MPETAPSADFGWKNLGSRTTTILLQLLLWVVLGVFYFAWNNRPNFSFEGPVWPLVVLQMGFSVLLFNALVYLIIPRWLLQGRTWQALAAGVAVLYAFELWMYVGSRLAQTYLPLSPVMHRVLQQFYVAGFWQGLLSPAEQINTFFGMLAIVLFPVLISFLAYALVIDRRRLALERDHLHLELGYLKSQINPQFLFNTLGSLHTMTRTRDERAGDVVLHLADLMRYTLYETDTERVPLSRELEFLEDYLALERLRHPETVGIVHTVAGPVLKQTLAPLLLHPFLERLFASLDAAPNAVANIRSEVVVSPDAVTLNLERTSEVPLPLTYRSDAAIGAALRRLALQYPGLHTVHLTETDRLVQVQLHLRL